MDSVRSILVRAKARIGTPERWCKGYHKAAHGCDYGGPTCAAFAITSLGYGGAFEEAHEALRAAVGREPVGVWNDAPERTHAEVMEAFDRAIAACPEESSDAR